MDAVETAECAGAVQVDWIDWEIGNILKAEDYYWLAHDADSIRERIMGV